jgi:nuclease-like protein
MRDWLYPYYCGAGLRARTRYEEASKRWQARVFRRPRAVFVGLATLTIAMAVVERHSLLAFVVGVTLGGLVSGFIALRESPPGYIENWRTGWEGERRTARALAPLRRSGCVLLHDLPDRSGSGRAMKGNVDHVVVSPGGVFLLDSKWLGGEVTIVGETVRVQRRDIDESYEQPHLARTMKARSARLQEDIASAGVRFVHPVVVFWGSFDAGRVDQSGVTFIHGDRLLGWLAAQHQTLTSDRVARIAALVEEQRPSDPGPWWARAMQLLGRRNRARAAWAPGSAG